MRWPLIRRPKVRPLFACIITLLIAQTILQAIFAVNELRRLRSIENQIANVPASLSSIGANAVQESSAPIVSSVSPISTTCGDKASCTGIFSASGRCTGRDIVPIKQQAWENADIEITRVGVGLMLDGVRTSMGYALVGNSAHADIMAIQIGGGSSTTALDPPFTFPGVKRDGLHIDVHVSCAASAHFQVWVLLYYSLAPASVSEGQNGSQVGDRPRT